MEGKDLSQMLTGCKQRDAKAQKAFYHLYKRKAKKICKRFIQDALEVEEVADDGLLKVLGAIQNYDENRDFEPWFRKIIIRTVYDHLRAKNATLKTCVLHNDFPHFKKPNAIHRANYNDLILLIEKLPPVYKSTFCLYHIDGFSHDEISGMLHISVSTSRSNLAKARKKLLSWMQVPPA